MGGEVRELAIYMFLVVCTDVSKGLWEDQKRFLLRRLSSAMNRMMVIMERLEGADEKFLDRITSVQTSRQPYVVKYVVDALMEDDEGEDAVALTEEPKGFLFLLLKTVIDVLDESGTG